MVEVVCRAVGHAQLLHHPTGPKVVLCGHGDDLVELQSLEAEVDGGSARLGRIAVPPELVGQPPAHFHGRGEGSGEGNRHQSGEARELAGCSDFDSPEPPAVGLDVLVVSLGHGVALVGRRGCRKELHHPWVGIQGGEGGVVLRLPLTKNQTLGFDHRTPSLVWVASGSASTGWRATAPPERTRRTKG